MIDGTYEIEIDAPLGRKSGTVVLRTDGNTVIGDIDAPVIGKQHVEGGLEGENAFSAQGAFKLMLVGKIEYTLRGEVQGDVLTIVVKSNKGDFELSGNRVNG